MPFTGRTSRRWRRSEADAGLMTTGGAPAPPVFKIRPMPAKTQQHALRPVATQRLFYDINCDFSGGQHRFVKACGACLHPVVVPILTFLIVCRPFEA